MRCALPRSPPSRCAGMTGAASHKMLTRLEPIPDRPAIDLGSLYDGNLISGDVSGLD